MFFDSAGKPSYPGKFPKEQIFDIFNDTALPGWLTTVGTSPIMSFGSVANSRGYARLQTKSATPTSGDIAGVQTNFTIDTSQFEEISFVIYSTLTDGAGGTDHNWNVSLNNGSNGGFYFQNNQSGGATQYRLYPAAAQTISYELAMNGNAQKRKDLGFVIRPRTKEFIVCQGDPYEGGGMIAYDKGNWADVSGQPLKLQVITRTAAQRYIEFSKIKLRLMAF